MQEAVRRRCGKVVEQPWLETTRIEDGVEPTRGKLLDLLVGQVDAATLRDPGPDVAHDLFDIDAIAALAIGLIGRRACRRSFPRLSDPRRPRWKWPRRPCGL